jgi:hypothetical protein
MKKIAIAMLAACALATSFSPAASAAAPDPLTDSGCSFTTATDPNPEAPPNTQSGYLYGGPIAQNGTLKCTIKSGVNTHTGTTPPGQSASLSGTGTAGVTYVLPGIVSYVSPPETDVYVCDQFTDSTSTTYYWDGDNNVWTTSSAVHCELAISGGTSDPIFDPVFDTLDTVIQAIIDLLTLVEDTLSDIEKTFVDPTVCPVLAGLAGTYDLSPVIVVTINGQGDIFLDGEPFWDCPPYDLFS